MSSNPGRLRSFFSRSSQPAAGAGSLTLNAIDNWVCPFAHVGVPNASVHIVAGSADWRYAAWTLATWCHFTESAWKLFIHDDGTLPPEAETALRRILPFAHLLTRKVADAGVRPILAAYPFAETLRADDPAAMRIFDTLHFSDARRFFIFSGGVLFLRHPREMIDWAEADDGTCWFTEGLKEQSIVPAAEAREELQVDVWRRVDDGIWMIDRPAFDFDFIDSALARTSILRGTLENATTTLAMLCAAHREKGGLLPGRFEVSTSRHAAEGAIARSYRGPARERFLTDGVPRVAPHLFAPDKS